MKPILILSSLAFLFASCEKKETTATETPAVDTQTTAAELCPVSGEELGSMGDPFIYVHEGREIKMCCEQCVPKFKKDPAKYLGQPDHKAVE